MTRAEHLIVDALSRCRLLPGSWDKRLVRDMVKRDLDEALTPRQSAALWVVAKRFCRQIEARTPALGEMIDAHLAALAEGDDLPGERGRFERALSLDPADWDTRRVYADWLEDHGEAVAAAGQRWQAEYRRRPELAAAGVAYTSGGDVPMNWQWAWHMGYPGGEADGPHSAPYEWHSPDLAWGRSRIEAERKMAEAIVTSDEKARR